MAAVEYVEVDGIAVSWYCSDCLAELGADDTVDPSTLLGQPGETCSSCGSEAIAWEPWSGEIADGRWFPHDADGHRAVEYRDAVPWG